MVSMRKGRGGGERENSGLNVVRGELEQEEEPKTLLILFLWLYFLPVLSPGVTPDTFPLGSAIRARATVVQLYPPQAPPMGTEVAQEDALTCANVAAVGTFKRICHGS